MNVLTFLRQMAASGRILLVSMLICCGIYTALILGIAQTTRPFTANGSILRDKQGKIIGSRVIAQQFTGARYFHPRPSAVDYNAAASGASNLSPANPALRLKAERIISESGADAARKIPADLVTSSGSGLDPDISLSAARFQAGRVAAARGLPVAAIMKIVEKYASRPGGILIHESLVNVLLVNAALDGLLK